MLATASCQTGNPADDLIKAELSTIGNMKIVLSDELAKRRIYPAIDVLATEGNYNLGILEEREEKWKNFRDARQGLYRRRFAVEYRHAVI